MIDPQKIISHFDNYSAYANNNEFLFTEAKVRLNKWMSDDATNAELENMLSMDYEDINSSTDSVIIRLRDEIYDLVAICDAHAREKNNRNPYSDKRIICNAGIRQNAWIQQLIKLKIDPNMCTEAIKNVINFINSPSNHFPIISAQHREWIANSIWNTYDSDNFDSQLLDWCNNNLNLSIINKDNKTFIYTNMLYDEKESWEFSSGIKGLVTRDGGEWKDDYIKKMDELGAKYALTWRDPKPNSYWNICQALRILLKKNGSFPLYFVTNRKATHWANVIDFSLEEEYDNVRDKWNALSPVGFYYDWDDYNDGNQRAKIAYLVDRFEKLPSDKTIDDSGFIMTDGSVMPSTSRNRTMAYTKIITEEQKNMEERLDDIIKIWNKSKNLILQGAPGVGKTFNTANLAVRLLSPDLQIDFTDEKEVMNTYNDLTKKGQIEFVTFHQSMDYEDFVEGIKAMPIDPNNEKAGICYKVEDGIFKKICITAETNSTKNYVLIIDEINRGNISKIFGELITLLEADKRKDAIHGLSTRLPYSNDEFEVPSNVYILGTMNTTDRSVGSLDYALRRRFSFYTIVADENVIINNKNAAQDAKDIAAELFRSIRTFIKDSKPDMDIEDLMIGHSYFMANDIDGLEIQLKYEIIPLLKEYINDGIIIPSKDKFEKAQNEWQNLFQKK